MSRIEHLWPPACRREETVIQHPAEGHPELEAELPALRHQLGVLQREAPTASGLSAQTALPANKNQNARD